ncbi:MAG: phosphatidylserine decarboxylase family protein [Pirellulales bacterium]
MSETSANSARLSPEPLPGNIISVQPGSGFCYRLELRWGIFRRWWLKRFRPGYVQRMAATRVGSDAGAPHEILDPRDLKFCRNLCQCDWPNGQDPFAWRERIPLARWGLAEVLLMGTPLLAAAVALGFTPWWYASLVPLVLLGWVLWFFRDPTRQVSGEPGLVISPADGKVVEIVRLDYHEFIDGPAVRIGIFLNIFNVHINRAPLDCRVIRLRYEPGKFLNALNPQSALENENMWIGLEEQAFPHRRLVVRQIAGAIARRIVCGLRSGEVLERGQKFGMIKLGSRTELILADESGLKIETQVGQHVQAGGTILAKYASTEKSAD